MKLPELLLQFTKDGQGDVAPVSDDERSAGVGVRIGNDDGDGEDLLLCTLRGCGGRMLPRFISYE